ncbi:MAG: type I-E CRISPR-associated protein Cse1/CasA, partial [Zoogloea sp.]|nr:type I-E CRISPR-associated protein Cse1/CasA [Zoogloea sp.]
MRLLEDPWLISADGQRLSLPTTLASQSDLVAPRPDFRSALYQFLIGLLQTTFAPADADEWLERWESPPDEETLMKAFSPWSDAFVLDGDGPAFMQDFDHLADADASGIGSLLIDQGSGSNQFFNKPDSITGFCEACAATALLTLQLNAPSGGRGHRVSLRGGGPLTCLLVPGLSGAEVPGLWHRLWLNVLPSDQIRQPNSTFTGQAASDILPWLAPTRTSEKKDGQTSPEHAHPLQAYWSMPRRIRLDWATTRQGACDICGAESERLLTRFRYRSLGINYL